MGPQMWSKTNFNYLIRLSQVIYNARSDFLSMEKYSTSTRRFWPMIPYLAWFIIHGKSFTVTWLRLENLMAKLEHHKFMTGVGLMADPPPRLACIWKLQSYRKKRRKSSYFLLNNVSSWNSSVELVNWKFRPLKVTHKTLVFTIMSTSNVIKSRSHTATVRFFTRLMRLLNWDANNNNFKCTFFFSTHSWKEHKKKGSEKRTIAT